MSDSIVAQRFWAKVDASGDCWIWIAGKSDTGYGSFRFRGGAKNAHTVAWTLLVGEVPDGMQLDHLCRVRECVNPDHLEPVTPIENARRAAFPRVGACPEGHTYTPENTYIATRRDGSTFRKCRICTLAYQSRPDVRARHNENRRRRRANGSKH